MNRKIYQRLLIGGTSAAVVGTGYWFKPSAPGHSFAVEVVPKTLSTCTARNRPGFFRCCWHVLRLWWGFLPCLIMGTLYLARLCKLRRVHNSFRNALSRSGPTFIKLAQWMSTRPDLFPPDLCECLAELRSEVPAHSFAYTKKTITQELGVTELTEIFEQFEERPSHSGCVAQVHKAKLLPQFIRPTERQPNRTSSWFNWKTEEEPKPMDGTVAVKVLHPSVQRYIQLDLTVMSWGATIASILPDVRWADPKRMLAQFTDFMLQQVDMRQEAENTESLARGLSRNPRVHIPLTSPGLISQSVFVERPGSRVQEVTSFLSHREC
eukprot:TRINITY_DN4169_c0_g1_i2.p1 TRINITY_DN4169_c0_g1~~TRINITY_DN4169_c0_g1_i2.p1  ORF type:complete len:323 (+),score=9.87 TRINITY_DN4169_c0_g1_i2:68-1036(+)